MRTLLGTALVLALSAPAFAGKGGSEAGMMAAVQSGSVDSIVAEIEECEYLPSTGTIKVVMPLIDHPSARVRDAAGWWLTRRDARVQLVNTCAQRLAGQDPVGARNCADALGGMRDVTTLQMLSQYLSHPLDEESGMAAAKAIGAIGDPSSVGTLTGALGSSMSGVRSQALQALRYIRSPTGTGVAAPVQPVLGTLGDASADVRRQAALTLGIIGRNGIDTSSAVQPLANLAMTDPSASVRKASVWALGQIKDPAGRNALVHALNDGDPFVRSIASAALAQLH